MADKGVSEAKKKVLTMKIVVDTKSNKLLYGEAGKEMVDFLLYFLTLPIGSVIKLLEESETGMVGCVANLYNSVQTIDASYLHNDQDKNKMLVNLTSLQYSLAIPVTSHLLLEHKSSASPKIYYRCSVNYSTNRICSFQYFSDVYGTECPGCRRPMTDQLTFVKENMWIGGGIVKGEVTYMVMDDLSITPLSTHATISILNEFNVVIKDVEENTVEIGMEEVLKLLKASLQSKTALSDVFVVKKETVVSSASRKRKSETSSREG